MRQTALCAPTLPSGGHKDTVPSVSLGTRHLTRVHNSAADTDPWAEIDSDLSPAVIVLRGLLPSYLSLSTAELWGLDGPQSLGPTI